MPQNAQLPVDQINFGFWLKSHKFLNSCGSSRGSVRFYKGKGSTMLRLFCRSSQKVYVLISANTVPPWFSRYICGYLRFSAVVELRLEPHERERNITKEYN